jgi:hypothetical protein
MQRMRVWGRFRSLCLAGTVAAWFMACDLDRPVRPHVVSRIEPSASHGPLRPAGTTIDLVIPANSAGPLFGGTELLATGIVVREGLNMRMRMPSTMTVTHNLGMRIECHWWWVPQGPLSPNGKTVSGTGVYGEVFARMTTDPGGSNVVHESFGWTQDTTNGNWTLLTYLSPFFDTAFVFLQRTAMDGECYHDPGEIWIKYFLSGQQNVTIDFPAVDVHADKDFVAQGGSAQFTAGAVDFTPSPNTWAWYWVYGTQSSIQVTACTGQTVCNYAPQQTGTMLVSVRESSTLPVKGLSDTVQVLKCPTGDSLLDHPIVRLKLRRALDSSYADSVTSKRRERLGLIYRDTTAGRPLSQQISTWEPTSYAQSDPCNAVVIGLPPPQPPYVLVAYYHTHPFSSGTSASSADIKPNNCSSKHRGRAYRAGPSIEDWTTALTLLPGGAKPGYIIDKDEVSKFDAMHPNATNPARRQQLVQQWSWNTAQCSW